jgi:glycosyltransferase involved in cell wall biosynthesis
VSFIGIEADKRYENDCAGIIYPRPHQSRFEVQWPDELIDQVRARMVEFPFLAGYRHAPPSAAGRPRSSASKSVKVLYLITVLAPAGAEQSLLAIAPRLSELGISLEVAYLRERPGLHAELEDAGIEVISLAGGVGGFPGRFLRTVRLIRQRRPDLVHTTLTEANLIGRLAGTVTRVPVVSSLVNVSYGPEQRAAPGASALMVRLRHLLDLVTARQVARFHAVTGPVAEVMASRLGVPRHRIDVVPRGRDPEVLGRRLPERRTRAREALGLNGQTALVVSIAHQDYQKGLDVLLDAMAMVAKEHPHARLVVAGRPGNQTEALQTMVDRLDLHQIVTFLGLRHDVPELLCAADVFVLASRWEGMGGVLLEAMVLEAPIVVSDLATLRDAVPDGRYALLVPPENPEALAAAMLTSISDPGAASERAGLARQRFLECFTVERVADEMVAFYRRAVPSGRQSKV